MPKENKIQDKEKSFDMNTFISIPLLLNDLVYKISEMNNIFSEMNKTLEDISVNIERIGLT